MTNKEIILKLKEDMVLRGMSESTISDYVQRINAYMKLANVSSLYDFSSSD